MNMEWQPIKTAPKDGREIRLATTLRWGVESKESGEDRIGSGFYDAGAFFWCKASRAWRNRIAFSMHSPSHWMECVEPPK